MLPVFKNEPLTDFSKPEEQAAFSAALQRVKSRLGANHPLVIGGRELYRETTSATINPSRPQEVLGTFSKGTVDDANLAVETAYEAFKTWQHTPADERARYLLKAAAEMRRRKHEFSAIMVLEVGKSWVEADADTAEAIDFLEYYARQAMRLADQSHMLTMYAPEQLQLVNIPLGVGAVIAPWNFPLAIPTGMMSAALVSGNAVVFKPAEISPLIAWEMCQLFWRQGIPDGVLNFLSGSGSVVGARIVDHPLTRFISFTGSKEVGINIHESAAKVHPGQKWLKRTILEMGGKDAVLVDETADLEAAAVGIVASAFGFQGQKCSAGSRAIIVREVYDLVVSRAVEIASKLQVGAPDAGVHIDMGPVVDQKSMGKIMSYIEVGTQEGELLFGGSPVVTPEGGYFLQPTIFGGVDGRARIAQEEIFGPVLAIIPADNFEHALYLANDTEFGLTGALYSMRRDRLEVARREYHVGNLYFNRKCTGALVGVHPFGGFNMSGTDSKAGSPDYLMLFMQAKAIAERL